MSQSAPKAALRGQRRLTGRDRLAMHVARMPHALLAVCSKSGLEASKHQIASRSVHLGRVPYQPLPPQLPTVRTATKIHPIISDEHYGARALESPAGKWFAIARGQGGKDANHAPARLFKGLARPPVRPAPLLPCALLRRSRRDAKGGTSQSGAQRPRQTTQRKRPEERSRPLLQKLPIGTSLATLHAAQQARQPTHASRSVRIASCIISRTPPSNAGRQRWRRLQPPIPSGAGRTRCE